MQCRITDLRDKEVINICDGSRLGFVGDVDLVCDSGQIVAIIVPGPCRLFGLLGREDDYVIPWACIRKFGDDIILVELNTQTTRAKRGKKGFF